MRCINFSAAGSTAWWFTPDRPGGGGLHRLGVQKRAKLEKKGVFLVIQTNFGKDMTDKLRKMHAKTRI